MGQGILQFLHHEFVSLCAFRSGSSANLAAFVFNHFPEIFFVGDKPRESGFSLRKCQFLQLLLFALFYQIFIALFASLLAEGGCLFLEFFKDWGKGAENPLFIEKCRVEILVGVYAHLSRSFFIILHPFIDGV